jgi:hypothetical protein
VQVSWSQECPQDQRLSLTALSASDDFVRKLRNKVSRKKGVICKRNASSTELQGRLSPRPGEVLPQNGWFYAQRANTNNNQ